MDSNFTKIRLYFFLAFALLAGCETSYDFNLQSIPKLTIVSHLAPGSWEGQRVHVYASLAALDSSNFYIPDNLVVDVTEEETKTTVRLEQITQNGKVYYGFPSDFLKAGNTYSITAFAPGFAIVKATTKIPRPSTISNLSVKDIEIHQSDAHAFKKIIRYNLVFEIDHFENNSYYHLIFYNQYAGLPNTWIVNPEPSDDQPFLQHYDYGVLVDRADLEDNKALTFRFQDWVIDGNELKTVYVELRSITEDYYKYHSSLARQLIIRNDPFAEPVSIYNNIDGGFGNFSGFSPNISSSDLPN